MAPTPQMRFGPFCLNPRQRRLWRGDEIIVLRPRAFAVLCYVAARPGSLVPREELLQQVWKGVQVSGAVVRACIRDIRAAFGDKATLPQYLETMGRQGYRFLGGRDGNSPERLDAGPVVGREAEVAQLQQWYRRALAGERQLVFLSGEVGIGKTTVVELFLASLIGSQARISRGQCVEQYGAGEPYLPILEALGHLGQAPRGERVVAALRRYAPMWLVQLTGLVPEAEWEPLRSRVWGMTRLRMLRELADVMAMLTAEMPLVMVLENLHWSDPATIDLLSYLAQRRRARAAAGAGDLSPRRCGLVGPPGAGTGARALRARAMHRGTAAGTDCGGCDGVCGRTTGWRGGPGACRAALSTH